MINLTVNVPAPVLKAALDQRFDDIQWCVMYPDGSYAIGLRIIAKLSTRHELYGRSKAIARSRVMKDMGFEVIEAGWMKPRNIAKDGPVVVFRIPAEGVAVP